VHCFIHIIPSIVFDWAHNQLRNFPLAMLNTPSTMTISHEPSKTNSAMSVDAEFVRGAEAEAGASAQLEARELKSRFNIWAAIGIQFSITGTPLAVGVYITLVLGAGGSPYFFYAFLVAAVGQMVVCICMAEIASCFPHASGELD